MHTEPNYAEALAHMITAQSHVHQATLTTDPQTIQAHQDAELQQLDLAAHRAQGSHTIGELDALAHIEWRYHKGMTTLLDYAQELAPYMRTTTP